MVADVNYQWRAPALVFPGATILERPGAPTRFGEVDTLAPVLRRRFDKVMRLEEGGANALRVRDVILAGARYLRTLDLLERHGITVLPLPVDEIGKVDAGLSCMSLRW